MKVIATGYQKQRLIIDGVDPITASITASVLNNIRAQRFLNTDPGASKPWWYYHAEADSFEVKRDA